MRHRPRRGLRWSLLIAAAMAAGCSTADQPSDQVAVDADARAGTQTSDGPVDSPDAGEVAQDGASVSGGDSSASSGQVDDDPDAGLDADIADDIDVARIRSVDCADELLSGPADRIDCFLATVPVDPEARDEMTTEISLAVIPGDDPDGFPMPVAVLQGGPGGASTDLTLIMPPQPFTQVFIDQRGTGFGTLDFNCTEMHEVFVEALEATSEGSLRLQSDAYRRCASRLMLQPEFAHTNTVSHAADAAEVMEALGYQRWAVYGVSYGTRIGLEMLRQSPAGLAAAVLDGVYPPDIDADAELARSADRVIAELEAACDDDDYCGQIQPDLADVMNQLMSDLDDDPVIVEIAASDTSVGEDLTVIVDGQALATITFHMLYADLTAALVPSLLYGFEIAEESLMNLAVIIGIEYIRASVIESAAGTYFAVTCADRLPFVSGSPEGMSAFAAAIVNEGTVKNCEHWDVPASPPAIAEPVESDLPVLLISGRFDPITPPELAARVAEGLSSAVQIVRDGRSHGLWTRDSCVDQIVEDFVADPSAALDVACSKSDLPLDWLGSGLTAG